MPGNCLRCSVSKDRLPTATARSQWLCDMRKLVVDHAYIGHRHVGPVVHNISIRNTMYAQLLLIGGPRVQWLEMWRTLTKDY